jgi:hypothetical protein
MFLLSPLRRRVFAALAAMVLLAGFGCASAGGQAGGPLLPPPTKRVTVQIDSNPSGTLIRVNGIRVGQAPLTIQLPVEDNGVLQQRTTISGDNNTNPRTPNSFSTASFVLEAGDDAPTRVWFTENNGTLLIETSGRAIPPVDARRRN